MAMNHVQSVSVDAECVGNVIDETIDYRLLHEQFRISVVDVSELVLAVTEEAATRRQGRESRAMVLLSRRRSSTFSL